MDTKPMIDLGGVVIHNLKSDLVPCCGTEGLVGHLGQANNREHNLNQPTKGMGQKELIKML
jgi:hypothetical protein